MISFGIPMKYYLSTIPTNGKIEMNADTSSFSLSGLLNNANRKGRA